MNSSQILESALVKQAGLEKLLQLFARGSKFRQGLGATGSTAMKVLKPGQTLAYGSLYQAVPETLNQTMRKGEVSPGEHAKQIIASLVAGRLLASPRLREAGKNYMTRLKAIGPNQTKEVLSLGRSFGVLGAPLTFNTVLPLATDTSGSFYNNLQSGMRTMEQYFDAANEEAIKRNTTPGQIIFGQHMDKAKEWLNQDTWLDKARAQGQEMMRQVGKDVVRSGAPDYFMRNLAMNAALAIPGTIAGQALGKALFPKRKNVSPDEAVRQYQKRMIAQTVGATALGFGGVALANYLMSKHPFMTGTAQVK